MRKEENGAASWMRLKRDGLNLCEEEAGESTGMRSGVEDSAIGAAGSRHGVVLW